MADEVLILNKGGYIGLSTCDELYYAIALDKKVRFLEEPMPTKIGCPPVSIPTEGDGTVCQVCGERYLIDLNLPDRLWNLIRPKNKPEGGGLLCGACIMIRLEMLLRATNFAIHDVTAGLNGAPADNYLLGIDELEQKAALCNIRDRF